MKCGSALNRLVKKIKKGIIVTAESNPINFHKAMEKVKKESEKKDG